MAAKENVSLYKTFEWPDLWSLFINFKLRSMKSASAKSSVMNLTSLPNTVVLSSADRPRNCPCIAPIISLDFSVLPVVELCSFEILLRRCSDYHFVIEKHL